MTTRVKTTAAALSGAVVLASGAYALGTQTGGGDATAKGNRAAGPGHLRFHGPFGGPDRGGPRDLSSLATKLGVSQDKLQAALDALRTEHPDDFATQLAGALGVDVSKVKDALGSPKPPGNPRDGFATALADKLGLDVSKVRSALDSLTRDDVVKAGGPAAAIAGALGVDESKVRDALQSVRPPGRPPEPDLATLAGKIGVTTAQLQAAFDKLRTAKRDDFANALAQKLGIDPQKVKDALPAGPEHRRFRP